ncbi:MAG: baseplate J/gp47 family protein [Solobacterium sp.]|nr:baseplate J/gp47 family protein [Solobacterium sp.]
MSTTDIKDFVRFDASGVNVANFTEIRSEIIKRYKEAYGSDIDLSTSSADGVFVNNLSLIMNNILQTMLTLYSNLDVENASGKYLDTLCNLSNIIRKEATPSSVSLQITNVGSDTLTNIDRLTFIDKSGVAWIYTTENPLSIARNETKEISAICEQPGPTEAPVGFIAGMMQNYPLQIIQKENAIVGRDAETDDELRARRSKSLGGSSLTILESLIGSLMTISGINDVHIYNNNENKTKTAKDGTVIDSHSVYCILRLDGTVNVSDETIGSIIHSKLTPGVRTTPLNETVGNTGKARSYTFVEKSYNTAIAESNQLIYWKEAVPIAPQIGIKISTYDFFTADEINTIGNRVISYLNKLPLSENLDKNKILIEAVQADPKFKGNLTYYVNSVTVDTSTYESNPDTYYHYTDISSTNVGNTYTITLL